MIYDLGVSERAAWTSFKYIANMIGDKTEPCLTPNLTANVLIIHTSDIIGAVMYNVLVVHRQYYPT